MYASPGQASTAGYSEPGPVRRGQLAISGDVRLDNRPELLESLGLGSGDCDLTVVLAGFERFGASFVHRLVGDFAFCLHDHSTDRLTIARDFIGVRPAYVTQPPDGSTIVGSQISGLATASPQAVELCDDFIARALVADFTRSELTPYQGIFRVPPGSLVEVHVATRKVETRRYWTPPAVDGRNGDRPVDELAGELAGHIERAVRARLPADQVVATQLTGGLDSSAVCATAARWLGPGQLVTFMNDPFGGGAYQSGEQPFVAAVSARTGAAHTTVSAATECCAGHDRHHHGPYPPYPHGSAHIRNRQYCLVRASGARVLLSGFGGDECVSFDGWGHSAELALHGRVASLSRAARGRAKSQSLARFMASEVGSYLVAPVRERRVVNRLADLCEPDFVSRTGLRELTGGRRFGPSADRNRVRWLTNGHVHRMTELYHWETARFGVELRYPLLDRRLVEWCLTVPASRWVADGTGRALFRKAMGEVLPELVADRKSKNAPDPRYAHIRESEVRSRDERFRTAASRPQVARVIDSGRIPGAGLDTVRAQHADFVCRFLSDWTDGARAMP